VQNDLLDVGADLSVPAPSAGDSAAGKTERERLRIGPAYTEWLEHACDEINAKLQPLALVRDPRWQPRGRAPAHLPHGLPPRGRRAIAVGEEVNPEVVRYLNRLSDCCSSSPAPSIKTRPGRGPSPYGTQARTARTRLPNLRERERASAVRRPATASAIHSVPTR